MINGTITYYLNEEGRKQSLLSGGNGKAEQITTVEITENIIDLFKVNKDGKATLQIGEYSIDNIVNNKPLLFEKIMAGEELIKFELDRRKEFNAKMRELQEYKVQSEKDKEGWIKTFGSAYLKKAYPLGYNCQRQYVSERATLEFPEYVLDFDDDASWGDRVAPSEHALDIVLELKEKYNDYNIVIVWLKQPPRNTVIEDEYNDIIHDFLECEAIVIRGFLKNYDLVKVV